MIVWTFEVTIGRVKMESLTNKICSILSVAKSPSWFVGRKINAIVTMICLCNRKSQVIVVAHIYKWVSKYVNCRNHLSLWGTKAEAEQGIDNREQRTLQKSYVSHLGGFECVWNGGIDNTVGLIFKDTPQSWMKGTRNTRGKKNGLNGSER